MRFLHEKAEYYGCAVVIVDRWFPSSQPCSDSGLALDRGYNAAVNILGSGHRRSAHGEAFVAPRIGGQDVAQYRYGVSYVDVAQVERG